MAAVDAPSSDAAPVESAPAAAAAEAIAAGGDEAVMPAATAAPVVAAAAPVAVSRRSRVQGQLDMICDYLLSERGCVKGSLCDFKHPLAPNGALTNHVCHYFGSVRGCLKGINCHFLHPIRYNPRGEPSTRICDFWLTAAGCVKASKCEFLHPRAVPAPYNLSGVHALGRALGSVGGGKRRASQVIAMPPIRPCKFVSTESGCRQGDACIFSHAPVSAEPVAAAAAAAVAPVDVPVVPAVVSATPAAASSSKSGRARAARVARVGMVVGVGSRGASIVSSLRKQPRLCAFFTTPAGCKKGDLCDYVHKRDKPCAFNQQGTCKKGAACDFMHAV